VGGEQIGNDVAIDRKSLRCLNGHSAFPLFAERFPIKLEAGTQSSAVLAKALDPLGDCRLPAVRERAGPVGTDLSVVALLQTECIEGPTEASKA
jgi:hypothetical protein